MKANKRSLVSLLQPVFQPLHRENELSIAINSRSVSAMRQNFTLTESFLQSANNARCSRKYLARSGCRLRYALTCLQLDEAMRQVTALPAILPYLGDTFNNVDRGVAVPCPDSAFVSLVNATAREQCSLQGHQEEEETRPATQHTYSVLLSEASRPAVT